MNIFKKLVEILNNELLGTRKGLSYKRLFKDDGIKEYFLEHRRKMVYYNQHILHSVDPDKLSLNYWNRI